MLVNVLKGADLVLPKHYKACIQERFETLTLRLDDMRPAAWFLAMSRPRPAAVWSIVSVVLVFVLPLQAMGGAMILLISFWAMAAQNLFTLGNFPRMAVIVGFLVAVPISTVVLWKLCPGLVRKLVGDGRVVPFLGRVLAMYLVSSGILGGFWLASESADALVAVQVGMAAAWPLLLPLLVLNMAALLLVTLLIVVWISRIVLPVGRWFCWRVVDHDRGGCLQHWCS